MAKTKVEASCKVCFLSLSLCGDFALELGVLYSKQLVSDYLRITVNLSIYVLYVSPHYREMRQFFYYSILSRQIGSFNVIADY